MSRLSQSARSWYTVSIPRPAASRGVLMWTGFPSHEIWPLSGAWIPAIHLISTDLPAPLSPASAVTCPDGTSRSTPTSACTGPKFLLIPRSRRSGSALPVGGAGGGPGSTSVLTVPVASPSRDMERRSGRIRGTRMRPDPDPTELAYARRRARAGQPARADVGGGGSNPCDAGVLDHRV